MLPESIPAPEWACPPAETLERAESVPRARIAALAAGIAVALAALGVPLGVFWAGLAPAVPLRVSPDELAFASTQPPQVIEADGWFFLLSVPFGILVAVGVWLVRPLRGPVALVALTTGAVATGLVAWWLGRQIGLGAFQAAAAAAEPGAVISRPADLRMVGASWWPPSLSGLPLVPALAATVTYTMLAAWSRYPSLRP